MKKFLMCSALVLLAFTGALKAQQNPSTRWVPYSAHYTETVSIQKSASTPSTTETLTEEWRSDTGSMLTVVKVGGTRTSGKLWQASGQRFALDYLSKKAISTGNSPRRHPFVPPDAPLGTRTMAGIQCTLYPLHVSQGSGTICVDMDNDILANTEMHTDIAGVRQDYVKQLTWIDLTTPVDETSLQIPPGFTKLLPSK
jgi:hypothetical protein